MRGPRVATLLQCKTQLHLRGRPKVSCRTEVERSIIESGNLLRKWQSEARAKVQSLYSVRPSELHVSANEPTAMPDCYLHIHSAPIHPSPNSLTNVFLRHTPFGGGSTIPAYTHEGYRNNAHEAWDSAKRRSQQKRHAIIPRLIER